MKRRTIGSVSGLVVASCVGLASVMLAADEGMVTSNNLQKAYNAELNAKARYEAFATKADEEGYRSVAILLRAAAYSKAIHAKHFVVEIAKTGEKPTTLPEPLNVKSTRENLEACLKGQISTDESMYPDLIKRAQADKNTEAAVWFKAAEESAAAHSKFFKAALDALDDWKAPGKEFAVCRNCGYTVMGQAPVACPVCSAQQEKFKVFSKYTIVEEQGK
jgi:rubrerythrin